MLYIDIKKLLLDASMHAHMSSWQQGERSVTMLRASHTCTAFDAASLTRIAANRQRTYISMNGNCKKGGKGYKAKGRGTVRKGGDYLKPQNKVCLYDALRVVVLILQLLYAFAAKELDSGIPRVPGILTGAA